GRKVGPHAAGGPVAHAGGGLGVEDHFWRTGGSAGEVDDAWVGGGGGGGVRFGRDAGDAGIEIEPIRLVGPDGDTNALEIADLGYTGGVGHHGGHAGGLDAVGDVARREQWRAGDGHGAQP